MHPDRRRTLLSALCACAFCGLAQSVSIGPGGAHFSEDGRAVLAPEPVQVGQELEMNALPVRPSPPRFYLNFGTRGRTGPFELAEGATVGSKQNAYTLRWADRGLRFTLHPAADTNAALGPFTATNGAPVQLGATRFTLLRVPPELTVSLAHPGRIAQTPVVGVAPLNRATLQALYELRAKYAALANRVDYDTADVEMTDVPRIYNSFTGNRTSPVVKTSERDKQNAYKGAELSAVAFLEKAFGQAFTIRSQAITDGLTFHFRLPEAGDYVLCATQRIKNPSGPSAVGTATAVWWTAFHFDGESPLAAALTAENAISWREVFALDTRR